MHFLSISTVMDKIISAFSWMLIHSLWQGLLLAIITLLVQMLAKRWGASIRYNLFLVLFTGFVTGCILTFFWEWNNPSGGKDPLAGTLGPHVPQFFFGDLHTLTQLIKTANDYFSANTRIIIIPWVLIFIFKSMRMFGALIYNHRIRNLRVYEPATDWKNTLSQLCCELQIKKAVELLESGYIKMPVVVTHEAATFGPRPRSMRYTAFKSCCQMVPL